MLTFRSILSFRSNLFCVCKGSSLIGEGEAVYLVEAFLEELSQLQGNAMPTSCGKIELPKEFTKKVYADFVVFCNRQADPEGLLSQAVEGGHAVPDLPAVRAYEPAPRHAQAKTAVEKGKQNAFRFHFDFISRRAPAGVLEAKLKSHWKWVEAERREVWSRRLRAIRNSLRLNPEILYMVVDGMDFGNVGPYQPPQRAITEESGMPSCEFSWSAL